MVPEIKKILFAAELSENSRHAFQYAAGEATRHGAGMVLTHVIDEVSGDAQRQLETLLGADKWGELQKMQKRSARDVLIGKRADYDIVHRALAEFYGNAPELAHSFDTHEIIVANGNVARQQRLPG